MLFLLELDICLPESLLTHRQDFGKTESVSECLDIRRLSPVTFSSMPRKPFERSKRRPRTDAQRNRERILEVAKAAFTRSGADASLDDIAKQAVWGWEPYTVISRRAMLMLRGQPTGVGVA